MADEEKTSDEGTTEAAPPKGKSSFKLLLILVASLAVGGSVGFLAIGPVVGSKMSAPTTGTEEHGNSNDKKSKGGGHGGGGDAESPLYNIENLVVNPAGTQGTRFLVVSIAIQIGDGGSAAALKERDPEVRDVLLHLLSSKTIEQLSNLVSRDSLKTDIKVAVEGVIGEGSVAKVFVPQFVLQ